LPMLLRTQGHPLRAAVEDFLHAEGIPYTAAAQVDDPDLIGYLIRKGKGVGAVNALALRDDIAAGRLVNARRKPTGIVERLCLTTSAHDPADSEVARVVTHLMTSFRL
ncbi:MAG: hypothetical protein KGL53_16665, partial [Elusimicrobia bacterium]|nr:hypothetical protein [Elusimicrobiota bacterium]